MKPPFTSSGGQTPPKSASLPTPTLPGMPALPDLPELPDIPALPDLPELPELPCLPCDQLWDAVDSGVAPITGCLDKAKSAVGDAVDQAKEVGNAAQEKATAAVDEVKKKVDENVAMAKKYADLYLNDAKQAWAGVSSVIAQQAGCAAQRLNSLVPGAGDAVTDKMGEYVDQAGRFVDDGAAAAGKKVDEAGKAVADKAKSAESAATGLAKQGVDAANAAQKKVFDTVYSAGKFVQDNGFDKLGECGSIPGRPEVPEALTDAFSEIEKGTDEAIRAGSDMIAQYEQNSVVQQAIYDAERYRDEGMSELASVADQLKSGLTDAIPVASECGGPPLPFDDSILDPDALERYKQKLMNEFDKMKDDAKNQMMNEIANQVTNAQNAAKDAMTNAQNAAKDAQNALNNAIPKPAYSA